MTQTEYDRIEVAATKVIADRLTQPTTPAPVPELGGYAAHAVNAYYDKVWGTGRHQQ